MKKSTAARPWENLLVRTAVIGPRISGEVTPFVLKDRLYRVENHPRNLDFKGKPPQYLYHEDEIRIRDVETDKIISVPLRDHYFGSGFLWDGRLYIFTGAYGQDDQQWWQFKRIVMTSSEDLINWTEPQVVIESENGERLFNTAVCRGRDKFIMLYEMMDKRGKPFIFEYCESDDLIHWNRIPGAIYGEGKYVGGPALYYEGGLYYTLYLESLSGKYETHVTRSPDLIHWQDAPFERPVVSISPDHQPDPEYYPEVRDINASDAELCFWKGKTIVYFNGGNQQGVFDLQMAEFAGTPRELLEHYYE